MNGFAALDIHPHRRYVIDIGGRRSSRCRLHINFALFLHSLDFTQNLGVTLQQSFSLPSDDSKHYTSHRLRSLFKLFNLIPFRSFSLITYFSLLPGHEMSTESQCIHFATSALKSSSTHHKGVGFVIVLQSVQILFP